MEDTSHRGLRRWLGKEPVATLTAFVAMMNAAIAMSVGFGLNWTGEQVALAQTFVGSAVTVVSLALFGRRLVSPWPPRGSQDR